MPQDASPNLVLERRYRDLVRLAYLVLPGKGKRIYRLAIAQRIVDGVLPVMAGRARRQARAGHNSYARLRTRVLRRAMRPSWRLRIGLGPWLRALPARLPDPALTLALAGLDPEVRVAYVLREVERLPRYAVRDQLVELGVRDIQTVLDAADEVTGVADLAAEPVDVVLARAVRHRSRLPIAAACALTIALLGALVVTEGGSSTRPAAAHNMQLIKVPPGAWTGAPPSLDVWPARGDLAADQTFTHRALVAWTRRGGAGADPQLLFAGHVDGTATALLRHGDRIARYAEPRRTLERLPAGAFGSAAPLPLGAGHFLLPPWTTAAETPGGTKVAVQDGVTGPVTARTRCQRGPLLRLREQGGSSAVADLGGPRPVPILHRSPTAAAPKAGDLPSETGLRLWDRLGCALPVPARAVTEAVAWEFWSGDLPGQTSQGPARWVCTRYAFADGGTAAQATLVEDSGKTHDTGTCDAAKPLSGTWWRSRKGRWFYLAAAARGMTPHVTGPVEVDDVTGRLLIASGPKPKRRPAGTVTLTAESS